MIKTDICIIGAGPGGAAAALRLAALGIPCILIDKSKFPRDKICGDALSGRTVTVLNRIDTEIVKSFGKETDKSLDSWGVQFSLDGKHYYKVPFKRKFDKNSDTVPSYIARRFDFDNHLINFVKKNDLIQFFEEKNIIKHEYTEGVGWVISDKDDTFQVACKILIVANGANSPFVRHTLNYKIDRKHYAGAVRAYYKNVTFENKDNFVELHFLKGYIPGYFWIFPLSNGGANVGLFMLSSHISDRKANLKNLLENIITTEENFKHRFTNATIVGQVEGFPLPLGSKRHKLSGAHFMLVGDAARLIDPLTGEGIGHAVYSGFIAAEQAEKCLKTNNFSANFMKNHDKRVWRVLGSELRISYLLQRLGQFPKFFNFVLWIAARNRQVSELVYSMFNDVDVRKKIINPIFWFKMLFNIK